MMTALMLLAFSAPALAQVYVPVLSEGFSKCRSSVPGGGYYAESSYFNDGENSDNTGWTSNSTYVSEFAVKLNAKTKTGWVTTPALQLSSDQAEIKVLFRGQTWAKDNLYLCVEIDGKTETVQKVDTDVSTNITDRSQAPFELTFTGVANGSKIKFYAEKRSDKLHRFFLSDVVVLEKRDAATSPALYSSAYFHGFTDLMAGNPSEVRTLDIAAAGEGEITLLTSESCNFSIEKTAGWDNVKGGRLNVTFTPLNAGSKLDALLIGKGDKTAIVHLGGKCKVYRPEALEAKDIADGSFKAAWKPAPGMDRIILRVYAKEEGELKATNLMFTKYIEGSSNNRAVEIYNGTGADVNLNGWKFLMESNGSGGLTAAEYKLPDIVLASGKTFTLCNAQYSALRDIADRTVGFSDGGYANFTTFTGDDALGLFDPEGNLVDLLGYESIDCNDRVNGNWGQDVTFYRHSDSYEPTGKFYIEEWERYDKDYAEGYGTHTMDARGAVRRTVATLELPGDATEALVEDLPSGVYYYNVEGVSNGLLTHRSAEQRVEVGGTGVDSVADTTATWTVSYPEVTFSGEGSVYTLDGKLLPRHGATVTLPARGLYIVKADGKAQKLVW